jgi:hypothetical protein
MFPLFNWIENIEHVAVCTFPCATNVNSSVESTQTVGWSLGLSEGISLGLSEGISLGILLNDDAPTPLSAIVAPDSKVDARDSRTSEF